MKGFIEVTDYDGVLHFTNIMQIEEVTYDGGATTIFFKKGDYIDCKESYEEVKAMIEKAVGE